MEVDLRWYHGGGFADYLLTSSSFEYCQKVFHCPVDTGHAFIHMSRVLVSEEPGFRKKPEGGAAVSYVQFEVTQTSACYNDNADSSNGNGPSSFCTSEK